MSSLRPYYPIFKFVLVFSGVYLLLGLVYYFYLSVSQQGGQTADYVTLTVAHQTSTLLHWVGYASSTSAVQGHPSVFLHVNGQLVYRVIEGCNAISVMILFVSFVIAFAKALSKTLLFLITGLLIIYSINILRLILLAIIAVNHKDYMHIAHEVFFPAAIYGTVILLWLYWVKEWRND